MSAKGPVLMQPSALIEAWQSAARDLGIEIVVPFAVRTARGSRLEADLLVKDFGAPRGTLVSATEDALGPLGQEIVDEGFSYSVFYADDFAYDRKHFTGILNDWRWTGPENRRPSWSK